MNQEWDLKHLLQSPRAQQDLINKVLTDGEDGGRGKGVSLTGHTHTHTHTFAASTLRERERGSMGI